MRTLICYFNKNVISKKDAYTCKPRTEWSRPQDPWGTGGDAARSRGCHPAGSRAPLREPLPGEHSSKMTKYHLVLQSLDFYTPSKMTPEATCPFPESLEKQVFEWRNHMLRIHVSFSSRQHAPDSTEQVVQIQPPLKRLVAQDSLLDPPLVTPAPAP